MKIICLMSSQLLPNYQLVKCLAGQDEGRHQVLCIFTESTRAQVEQLVQTFARHLPQASVRRDDSLYIDRADHVAPTEQMVAGLLADLPHEEWVVNCVGGTKMMASGALLAARGAIAKGSNVRALYVDIDQPGQYVDAFTGALQPMYADLSVAEYLDLYGIPVPEQLYALEGQKKWEPFCIAWCALDPRTLPLALPQNAEQRRSTLNAWRTGGHGSVATLPWHPQLGNDLRDRANRLLGNGIAENWQMRLLTGDLLDNFVYAALWRYADKLDISEVRRWVRSKDIGEVDLCVVRGGELVLIECKAGRQAGQSVLEQLARLDLRRQRIGAKKSRSMLISSGANLFEDAQDRQWSHDVTEAVSRGSIQVIARPHIQQLARAMQDNQHELAITTLKGWLDGGLPALY